MNRLIFVMAAVLIVTACRGPVEPPQPAADENESSNVIGAPLQKSLDKAHSVQDLNGSRKGQLDDAIDAGSSRPE